MSDEPLLTSRPWRCWAWLERSTVGLPLALLVFDVVGTSGAAHDWRGGAHQAGFRPLDWIAWAAVVAGPAALYFRIRFPRTVLAVILAATMAYLARGYTAGPIWLNVIIVILGTMAGSHRRAAWIGAAAFAIGIMVVPPYFHVSVTNVVSTLGWFLAVTAVPELVRVLRQRAQEAQAVRAEEARRRAGEERLAIARELHDVLAHSISLIAVQANVALEVMDRRPEQARIALTAIKDVSRTALGEVRSVLDVLRGTESPPRDPAPGLDRLGDLVRSAEAAGLAVRVEVVGDLGGLPVAVDQAAYRIVQESLTNVVRHARATSVGVRIECDSRLWLRIIDDGPGAPAGALAHFGQGDGGNGIPGMRERALALGGTLTTRRQPFRGFRVDALLPVAAERRTGDPK